MKQCALQFSYLLRRRPSRWTSVHDSLPLHDYCCNQNKNGHFRCTMEENMCKGGCRCTLPCALEGTLNGNLPILLPPFFRSQDSLRLPFALGKAFGSIEMVGELSTVKNHHWISGSNPNPHNGDPLMIFTIKATPTHPLPRLLNTSPGQ